MDSILAQLERKKKSILELMKRCFTPWKEQTKASAEANDAKLEGNRLFGASQFEEAMLQYEVALKVAPDMPLSVEIRSTCHANRALCFLKLGKYEDTIKECTKALELNANYVKALRRRGAHEKLVSIDEAISEYQLVDEDDEDFVELLCCGVPKQVVARGCIVSKDPLKFVNGRQLRKDFWEVNVKEIVQSSFINPSWVGVNMRWKAADVISM